MASLATAFPQNIMHIDLLTITQLRDKPRGDPATTAIDLTPGHHLGKGLALSYALLPAATPDYPAQTRPGMRAVTAWPVETGRIIDVPG